MTEWRNVVTPECVMTVKVDGLFGHNSRAWCATHDCDPVWCNGPEHIVRGSDRREKVDHPSHYGGDTTYETIKVIEAWELDFCLGNAVKYISRAGRKNADTEAEDLHKAMWYLKRRIEQLER